MYVKPLNEYKQTPMDNSSSGALVALSTKPLSASDMDEFLALDLGFVAKVFMKRLNFVGLYFHHTAEDLKNFAAKKITPPEINLDPNVVVFMLVAGAVGLNSPGISTLYVHALYHAQKRKGELFTLSDLCNLFPRGFPDEQECTKCWDAQKSDTVDNLLDSDAFFAEQNFNAPTEESKMDYDRTATGVVLLNNTANKVLLVTSLKVPDLWVLPKGGLEPDLTPEENALKEMREEAGIAVNLGEKIFDDVVVYEPKGDRPGKRQREIYFTGSFLSYVEWEEFNLRRREWFSVEQAKDLMSPAQYAVVLAAVRSYV